MGVVIMVAQLILSLSILVVLHELGHFLPAKLFNTRVEKFYLFFDPYFSLFKFKKGDTEYGIGWLPLGGYVKIAGMIDESFDKEQLAQEPQPWEFRSKPTWQRLIIMLGGVTVNFLLGFFIFAMLLFTYGENYLPPEEAKYGVETDCAARNLGIRNGDIILGVNGEKMEKFRSLRADLILKESKTLQVIRDGKKMDLPLDSELVTDLAGYRGDFVAPRYPFEVETALKGSGAEKAGVKEGDKLYAVNGAPVQFFGEFTDVVKENKGKDVEIGILRGQDSMLLTMPVNEEGMVGIQRKSYEGTLNFKTIEYSFLESFPAGYHKGMNFLSMNVISLGKMFTGSVKAKDSLGSFISIGKLFSPTWDWRHFWTITASLSLILAFMNILPIPLLDGGHVVFLVYEMITGRPPNEKFQEYAQMVGLFLVAGLMLFAIGLDILREMGWISSAGTALMSGC